ncbi:MAG TPA: dTMP kinase [Geminicoccus sp.]|jgi:dTMP kinase|uniref:dTMP kinase n=1 Tax=Geminicoccus sp. TaxID=2024832 RepID=UPI002E31BF3E|nr:dTMP kinase [Geminicoccus sp.]HEX2529354.1 dTMP kinase [Geminicoccus sp.]
MGPGRLITFEGGEGTGKSTQLPLLADHLRAAGLNVVTTREPGGTEGAERIRELAVLGATDRWSPVTELLLMTAARTDHVERVIMPALQGGSWVLCDRFIDSTRVYQGVAGGLGLAKVDALHDLLLPAPRPDLTLLLDLPVEAAAARRAAAGGGGRFEAKGRAFHEQVRAGFLGLARAEPARMVVVDASLDTPSVARAIAQAVRHLVEPAR